MGAGPVRLLHTLALWNGLVAEMRCVAFEIDTVKLLMSIFVRNFGAPEFCIIHA
jgi:hypothetical protein